MQLYNCGLQYNHPYNADIDIKIYKFTLWKSKLNFLQEIILHTRQLDDF